MRKFLIGVAAVVAAAVLGFFGTQFYLQQRIAGDVDAALAQMRANGAAATRGRLAFDLVSRTLTIADIVVKSDAQPAVDVKIGHFTAERVDLMQTGRFAADRIAIADVEAGGTLAMQGGLKVGYSVPSIDIVGYSGPAAPLRPFDPASPLDLWRFALEHFAAMTAASITIPSVTSSVAPSNPKGFGPATYTYSGLTARGIQQGRVAAITVDRVSFTTKVAGGGREDQVSGDIERLAVSDFDSTATLAMLDPASLKDDTYRRAYRQVSTGPYTATIGSRGKLRIDAITVDDLGIRPSRLQITEIIAMVDAMPAAGATASPAQLQQMLRRAAIIYEGLRIARFEMRGLAIDLPEGATRIGTIRLSSMEDGRIDELAFEDAALTAPTGPVKIGRFALKRLAVANLLRDSAQLSGTRQKPTPEQVAALLRLIGGVEMRNMVAPYKNTGKPVNIDTIDLSWGAYIGPIPSRLRAVVKMSGPVEASDPDPFKMLTAAGFDSATINLDLGAAWTEGTRTFALAPATIELGNVGTLSARLSLGNVPREIFTVDPFEIMVATALIEAGPIEIVVRDTGGIDLAVAQYARTQNLTREAARQAIMDNARRNAAGMAALSSDAMAIGGALARFVETPRGTLTLRLTPKGKVPLMDLIEAAKANPADALARFQVDVVAGR
jgi:hypothetical protein